MKVLHTVTFILIVVGGLNWGLVGAFDFNLVNKLVGDWSMVEKVIYILVGLSAIVEVATHKSVCKMCAPSSGSMSQPSM
jgi:uncharacterized membrane protein YuzA (DUF378 family)